MNFILKIAVFMPLRHSFDYLAPSGIDKTQLIPGIRIRIPFGRKQTVGILLDVTEKTDVDTKKLKTALEILDHEPLLTIALFQLATWASHYYQYPIGEVMLGMMPQVLRQGRMPAITRGYHWEITAEGQLALHELPAKAKQQKLILSLLTQTSNKLTPQGAKAAGIKKANLTALIEKGWIKQVSADESSHGFTLQTHNRLTLNEHQQAALAAILSQQGFHTYLLQGVTGSGKTEVYLQAIEEVLQAGKQALVLVPEIGLTPQTVSRFQKRFNVPIVVLHSDLSEGERASAWLQAGKGKAHIIIGTRSAIFTPLSRPGIIILDEEHDPSFKQQSGFRYSARDLAILRARLENIPVVLGSATPSLESLYNAQQGRYTALSLPERVGNALHPSFHIIDLRQQFLEEGLSVELLQVMQKHLNAGGQVILFLNRRGYAPILLCHVCGWSASCRRCDAKLTLHQHPKRLICHHCGAMQTLLHHCDQCQSTSLVAVGIGTERLEEALKQHFPHHSLQRIDRDTTRRKGSLEKILENITAGESQILIGTQMLAKGHHFPDVTLVAIIDGDSGLYSADFRASERMAQLIIQVAGRAGRAEKPGQVYIQTHNPTHPLLNNLIQYGYAQFANALLHERQATNWPPYSSLALLRAEAVGAELPLQFLQEARNTASLHADILLLGPIPAPMERKAGLFRALLLIQSNRRAVLQNWLTHLINKIEKLKIGKKVRWSIDVDPTEIY